MLKQLIIMVMFLGLFMFACDKTEPEPSTPQSQLSLSQEKPEPNKPQQPEKPESKKPPQKKPEPKKTGKDPGLGANKGTSEVVSPTLLIDAIKKGEVAKAKGFISSKKVDLNGKDSNGYAPLNYASLYGHKDIVDELLAHNAKVDEAGPFNLTALHYAAFLGNKDIAESLIKKGANVNAVDNYKNTPLHYAYYRGHDDLKDLLKANGADEKAENNIPNIDPVEPAAPNKVATELTSAILFADDMALVAALIERHPLDINAPLETLDVPPLKLTVAYGRPVIFKFLKGKGADLSKISQLDVFIAVPRTDAKFFADLLDATGTKATAVENNTTLLRRAFDRGKAEIFELLVDRGADINETEKDGSTFLDKLANEYLFKFEKNYGLFNILKTLLKKEVQVKDLKALRKLQDTIVYYTVNRNKDKSKLVGEVHVPTDLVKEVFALTIKRAGIAFNNPAWQFEEEKKALKDLLK